MAWMMADAGHHMDGGDIKMAGLASPADLTRLQRATGRDNEVLFLQLMTRHHQGGIEMAAYAVRHTTTTAVHQTAVAMIDEQSQEVVLMAYLLKQRNSAPLALPTHDRNSQRTGFQVATSLLPLLAQLRRQMRVSKHGLETPAPKRVRDDHANSGGNASVRTMSLAVGREN